MTVPDDWVLAASGFERARQVGDGKQTVVYDAEPVHDYAWCAAPAALMEVVEADFDPGRDVPVSWFEEAVELLDQSPADLELPPMKLRLLVPVEQRELAPRMITAARLSLAGFIIPFVFVYHPAVLYKLQVMFEWFGDDPVSSKAMIDIATVTWGEDHLFCSSVSGSNSWERGRLVRTLKLPASGR